MNKATSWSPGLRRRKAVLLDDRWASAREDLVRFWLADEDDIEADWQRLAERFEGAGHVAGSRPRRMVARPCAGAGPAEVHYAVRPHRRGCREPGRRSLQRRGRGRHRCVEGVDRGGRRGPPARRRRRLIVTTSRLDDDRLDFYKTIYRDNARFGAALWVLPANAWPPTPTSTHWCSGSAAKQSSSQEHGGGIFADPAHPAKGVFGTTSPPCASLPLGASTDQTRSPRKLFSALPQTLTNSG